MRFSSLIRLLLLITFSSGCSTLGFITQAAVGQLEFAAAARPIPEVIADPDTSAATRGLLSQVEEVRRFAAQNGLKVGRNYLNYVQLDRDYPVWFVNASAPLEFRAKVFSFPIVGSFPGLSWFDKRRAEAFRDALRAEGWDVYMRGVSAFSTGGWFDDPVTWSMLSKSPGELASLVNTLLHESVHATVLIKNQQYFNESLASFIADTMTAQYLQYHSGQALPAELRAYEANQQFGRERVKRLNHAYLELAAVYSSARSDRQKYAMKAEIIDRVVRDLHLTQRPNNASLIGFRLYAVGGAGFSALYAACGYSWRRFLSSVSSVSSADFGREQCEEIARVLDALRQRGCPERLFPLHAFEPQGTQWHVYPRADGRWGEE